MPPKQLVVVALIFFWAVAMSLIASCGYGKSWKYDSSGKVIGAKRK